MREQAAYTIERYLHIRGPMQSKPTLFKGWPCIKSKTLISCFKVVQTWAFMRTEFCISTSNERVPIIPHSHQHLVLLVFWIFNILLDLLWYCTIIIIWISWWHPMYSFLQMLICHFCIFFGELLRSLANFINNWVSQFSLIIEFVFLLFSFKCPFYILNYNPLSHVSIANISFLSVACLFIQLFLSELKILINPGVQNKLYSSVE